MFSAVTTVTAVTSGIGFILNSAVLYLVLSQGRRRYHYLFAGVLAICAVWDLSIFLMMVRNKHVHEVEAIGYAMIPCGALPALIYHFACCYLNQPRKWTTIIFWAFAILGIIAMLTGLAGRIDGVFHYPWGNIFRPDQKLQVAFIASLPFWYLATLTACWLIYRAYHQEIDPIARRHLLYILASLIAISLAIVKVVVVLGVQHGFYLTFGMLFNDMSAAIIGVAIIKDRLFNITPIIKLGLIYSALAMLVIFVFSFSEHILASYVAERFGGHSEFLHAIAIAMTIAILMPVKRRVEHAVEVYFANKKLRF